MTLEGVKVRMRRATSVLQEEVGQSETDRTESPVSDTSVLADI